MAYTIKIIYNPVKGDSRVVGSINTMKTVSPYIDSSIYAEGYKENYGKSIYSTNKEGMGDFSAPAPYSETFVPLSNPLAQFDYAMVQENGIVEFDTDSYADVVHYTQLAEQLAEQGFSIETNKRLSSFIETPDADENLNLGDKTVSDLIKNLEVSYKGDNVIINGEVQNIKEPWTEYSQEDNVGHFIPIKLPEDLIGKKIIAEGITPKSDITLTDDCLLIVKMEHIDNLKFTLKTEDGQIIGNFDLTNLVPTGEKAFNADKKDFGSYGSYDDYFEDFKISWNGIRGSATGIIKKHPAIGDKVTAGNDFPLALSDFYFDGVPKRCFINNDKVITQQDIILKVTSTDKMIKVIYQNLTVMEINISQMKLGPLVGKEAVTIPENGTGMDSQIDDVAKFFSRRPTIKWEGTKGTVSGELKWYKFENGHFAKNPAGHFMPFIIKHHDNEMIKVTGSDGTETSLVDPKWTIRVDDFVNGENKICKMYANDDLIAELDFSQLVLNLPRGKDAFTEEKDHGDFGNAESMYENITRTWDEETVTKCKVAGKLKKLAKAEHPAVKDDPSYYFGFTLTDDFLKQNVEVRGPSGYKVVQNPVTDTDYVIQIKEENKTEPIYVYGNDRLTAVFDLSEVELEK